MISFLFASLVGFAQVQTPTPTPAPTPDCLSQESIQSIESRFQVHLKQKADFCDPNNQTRRLYEALLFGDGIQTEGAELPAPWNQNLIPQNWLSDIQKLTPIMEAGEIAGCEGMALAYVRWDTTPKALHLPSAI